MTGLEMLSEMWTTLSSIHEQQGQQTITSTKHGFYMQAMESADILKHIIQMKHTHNKLHQMGCLVPNNELQSILVTLLPESWDHFSASYFSIQSSAKSTGTCKVTTQELCNIIGYEYHCCQRESRSDNINDEHIGKKWKVDKAHDPCKICDKLNHITTYHFTTNCCFKGKPKCNNCRWFRHITANCRRKGGEKEEPEKTKSTPKSNKGKEHANKVCNVKEDEEMDVTFNTMYNVSMNENDDTIDMYSWVADLATMSHICNN
ncbi:hypothetical protein PAXRUDRAFT_150724 [Paxillus rubicundulus Ve08.2h10]|uniref:Uncharacterized protein n=1 Tax=Paxillus rubicundulus Ve08.2h10 TaxID=930991 RepID=A0A0D0DSC7_9AGAM|nr:hypothetical protein PAXRUDRAFT_150724 [Paxillus rubicundulus Ve08.2h10]